MEFLESGLGITTFFVVLAGKEHCRGRQWHTFGVKSITSATGHRFSDKLFIDHGINDFGVEGDNSMPEICRFFGIIIRMYFDEHNPPHFHTEFDGNKAVFDLLGNITRGDLKSRTAVKLIREWIDLHKKELEEDWNLSRSGKPLKEIAPLD